LVVVGKRHHIRFFPMPGDGDRTGNCKAGLVVDQGITDGTSPYSHFYLQSQGGLKGTSRPSHYAVVYNEDKSLTADKIQGLTFALCHTHARATRSIGIPAPVYYADLVCARIDFHLKGVSYDSGSTRSGETAGAFDLSDWDGNTFLKPKYCKEMYFI